MLRFARLRLLLGLAGVAALALATGALAASTTVVSAKHTSLGTILVTGSGRTLYLDVGDHRGHFACTGSCLKAWPPLKAQGKLVARGGAKASLLGHVKGPGGEVVTYAGHPLYMFAGDSSRNPTSGEGKHGFYAVSPSGGKVTRKTTTTTTSSHTTQKKPTSKPPGY